MWLFIGFAILIAGAKAAHLPPSTGKYYQGFKSGLKQTPFVVSIQWNHYHFCTGTIYDRWSIITSAGCVKNIQTDDVPLYTVRAGSSDHRRFGQSVNVKSIIKHPDYQPFKAINDIALLKLQRPLILGDTVQPIVVNKKKLKLPKKSLVSGWTDDNGRKDTINHIIAPLIPLGECAEKYGASAVNSSTQLCVGESKHENCQGDSGSGIVVDFKLVGVVTHNTRCDEREFPSLHTKISCLGKWVKSQVV